MKTDHHVYFAFSSLLCHQRANSCTFLQRRNQPMKAIVNSAPSAFSLTSTKMPLQYASNTFACQTRYILFVNNYRTGHCVLVCAVN